jgi:hypothetical protein
MTTLNAIKKLEKATGNKVSKNGNRYSIETEFDVIAFISQSTGNITCISVCRKGLESCLMTDYFPQTYCDNINQALRLAN